MGPPQQSLDGQDLATAQVELGLVMQDEVALVDGRPQLLEEPHLVALFIEVSLVAGERGVAQLGSDTWPRRRTTRAPRCLWRQTGAMAMPMLAPILALTTSSTNGSAQGWR